MAKTTAPVERKPDLEPAYENVNGKAAALAEPPPTKANALADERGLPLVAVRDITIRSLNQVIKSGEVIGYLTPAGNLSPDQCRKLVAKSLVMVSEHVLGPGPASI